MGASGSVRIRSRERTRPSGGVHGCLPQGVSAQAPSCPAALRTNSGCFVQWQLRVRTTERGRNITEVNNVDSRNEVGLASATEPWPSPGTQQRDQSIEWLQRQSKSARRTSIRNAGAQSAVFGSPPNVRAVEVKLRGPFSLRALLPSYRSNAVGRSDSRVTRSDRAAHG